MFDLPRSHLAVLRAMIRPDPAPPVEFDTPAEAIARRLPGYGVDTIAAILHGLNALGLTSVPYVSAKATAASTADPKRWITDQGWAVLQGAFDPGGGPRPS